MTKTENRIYELSDEAVYIASELEQILHSIRYDPKGATAAEVKAMEEINDLLAKAARIAKETEERMSK